MICPKCGSRLPEDSVFCQFCGVEISKVTTFAFDGTDPLTLSKDTTYISSEEIILDEPQNLSDPTEDKTSKRNPQLYDNSAFTSEVAETPLEAKINPRTKWRGIVALCLLTLLAAINAFQFVYAIKLRSKADLLEEKVISFESENMQLNNQVSVLENNNSELQSQINSLSSSKSDLQTENTKLKRENSGLQVRVKSLESDNSTASIIYQNIRGFSYGTKYSDYYSDTETLIVRVGETKSFNITYTVTEYSTVSFQGNNTNSTGEWGKDWNYQSCAVKVTGKTAGTTTYTFTNDYNTHMFKVLIIILPKS